MDAIDIAEDNGEKESIGWQLRSFAGIQAEVAFSSVAEEASEDI